MKVKKIGGIFFAGLLAVGLAACAKAPPEGNVETLQLVLNAQNLELAIGENYAAVSTVTADGTVLAEPAIEWSSSDPIVATVADGVITAHEEGNATITADCQYGGKNASATVKVTVGKPTVELEMETPVIIDLSMEDGGLVAFDLPAGVPKVDNVIVGDSEYRIVSQGDQVLINTTFMMPGEYIMTALQETQDISFPVYIVTAVINSAEDLKKAVQMPNADTGYFVLGSNIDCASLNEPICFLKDSYFETALGQNRQGFRGGFNGMGYTISNLQVPENGLFGCIGASGVVRNLALVNISSPELDASVLCRDSAGLVSQVYVQGDFGRVMYASYSPTNKLENIVAESTRSDALLCQHIATVDTDGYSVSEVNALIMVGQNARVSGWSRNKTFSDLVADEMLRVASATTRDSIPAVTIDDGFNHYWDISSGYPIFISSVQ